MTDGDKEAWHREVIPAPTEEALDVLREACLLEDFYLAGGTGLALQFGHRLSLDLDFFAREKFEEDRLLDRMQMIGDFALASKAPYTLHATIKQTKVSFLGFPYPVLFPPKQFLGVAVADPRDIACMKVSAIASRGAKRDFVDLYFCAQRLGLAEILRLFDQKFTQANFSKIHLLKSLTYFADAEKDPMPRMLAAAGWDEIRQYFLRETPRLLR